MELGELSEPRVPRRERIFWLVSVRYRPNAASGGWSYERDFFTAVKRETPALLQAPRIVQY